MIRIEVPEVTLSSDSRMAPGTVTLTTKKVRTGQCHGPPPKSQKAVTREQAA